MSHKCSPVVPWDVTRIRRKTHELLEAVDKWKLWNRVLMLALQTQVQWNSVIAPREGLH